MTDFESVDYFTDQSLVPDPYPYFDYLRSSCPVRAATAQNVLAVTALRDRLDVAFGEMAAASEFTPLVHRLGCGRGIGSLIGCGSWL